MRRIASRPMDMATIIELDAPGGFLSRALGKTVELVSSGDFARFWDRHSSPDQSCFKFMAAAIAALLEKEALQKLAATPSRAFSRAAGDADCAAKAHLNSNRPPCESLRSNR